MSRPTVLSHALLAVALLASRLPAQEHTHSRGADEQLGTVHFATSCSPGTAPTFDRGIALLHSFEFGASIGAFNQVIAADSACAMAHWGSR